MPINDVQTPGRSIDWGAMAREAWGDQWSVPEVVYEFSNGRQFLDSGDRSGIYNPTA